MVCPPVLSIIHSLKFVDYLSIQADSYALSSTSSELSKINTVELQWLENLWSHENMFETAVVRASEC